MRDLSRDFPLFVEDEFALLASLVPLAGARVLDVGCGAGGMSSRIRVDGGADAVVGIDVDDAQLAKNAGREWPAGVSFQRAGAQALPFGDATFNAVTLFKSLHHVPVPAMDVAFREFARVLRPGGRVHISEPVYEGAFNDVMRLFHDEGVVRAEAMAATDRAVVRGLFRLERRVRLLMPVAFRDFDEFRAKMMAPTHSDIAMDGELLARVRSAFGQYQSPNGARFIRPVRVDVLVRA